MRVAITGGSGFLGRAVAEALVAAGIAPEAIRSVARTHEAALEPLGVEQVAASVLDARALRAALDGADVVYHLAGRVSRDPRDAASLRRLHVEGTRITLEAALDAGASRVVLGSTSGTVGCFNVPDRVALDSSPFCDATVAGWPYYATKIAGERLAWRFHADRGLPIISLNPSLLLGPGDLRGSSTGDLANLLAGRVPSVPRGGVSVVDVRDAAAAFAAARDAGEVGTRYLIGAENLPVADLLGRAAALGDVRLPRVTLPPAVERLGADVVERVARALGLPPPVDRASVEMAQHWWYLDASRARRDLGFSPRPLDETLRDTLEDLRRRGAPPAETP